MNGDPGTRRERRTNGVHRNRTSHLRTSEAQLIMDVRTPGGVYGVKAKHRSSLMPMNGPI